MSDITNRAELVRKRDELEDRLEQIRNDIAGGLNPDLEEQAIELENRDVLIEIARITEEELEDIKRKLENLPE